MPRPQIFALTPSRLTSSWQFGQLLKMKMLKKYFKENIEEQRKKVEEAQRELTKKQAELKRLEDLESSVEEENDDDGGEDDDDEEDDA